MQCPYYDIGECVDTLLADALAYIQQLEEQSERRLRTAEMLNDALKEVE